MSENIAHFRTTRQLAEQGCKRLSGQQHALTDSQIATLLALLPGWQARNRGITKQFRFTDYAATLTFVNAVADIAVREDHHPDITFGYNSASVHYATHDVGGLSLNDFICAAKVDALAGH